MMTFKNKEEALLVREHLLELSKTLGWKHIHDYFIRKLEYFDQMLREGEINDIHELKRIRDRRNITEQFMNLPDILASFVEASGGVDIEFDPYEKLQEVDNDIQL